VVVGGGSACAIDECFDEVVSLLAVQLVSQHGVLDFCEDCEAFLGPLDVATLRINR
jgi:hypothetical protein